MVEISNLKPSAASAFLMTVHAFEYAISIDTLAARRDFSERTRRSSSATPGPKHLLSPKIRTVKTGLKLCSIRSVYHSFAHCVNIFRVRLTKLAECVIL